MENKILVMIVSLAILSITSGIANAASFDMKVELLQDVSTCPTITADAPPLNKDDMPIYIQNFYEYPDTFKLTLELPEGWHGFVEPNFIVASNQKKLVDPIWITVPDTKPGVYQVSLKAKSGQTGDEIKKTFSIEVLSCHHVELTATDAYKEVCREKPTEAKTQIKVANQGLSAETFALSVYQGSTLVDWVAGSPSITVPAGEDRVITFDFARPDGISGDQKFRIVARSTSSYAEASVDVTLMFKDCYSFTSALEPQQQTTCSGETGEYSLTITNTGMPDTYKITAPEWVVVQETVSLDRNEKKTIPVTASNDNRGTYSFDIIIDPQNEEGTRTVTGSLVADECRGIAIVISPEKSSLCSGELSLFKVMVKNTGGLQEQATLSTDYGVLETGSLTLAAKEVKTIDLVVDTKNFTGEKVVTVTARSGIVEDHAKVTVTSENCYSSTATVTPSELTLCSCETGEVTVEVKNTGKLDDTFRVSIGTESKQISIKSGENGSVKLPVKIPCDAKGSYKQMVEVKSNFSAVQKEIMINLENASDCYAVKLYNGDYVEVQPKRSFAVPITIKNLGKRSDSYKFSIEGPEWAYIEPLSTVLEPGEEDMVFVYISPPFNVVKGEHTATVKVVSEHTADTHKIVINVTEGMEGVIVQPETPETNETEDTNQTVVNETEPSENVTLEGDSGVVLNASLNESELPTAKIIQLERTTRLVIVGVIVVAVIIILIIRFMTLVK